MIVPIPYFTGGSDPGELRDYLNRIIRFLNTIALVVSSLQTVRVVRATTPPAYLNIFPQDGTIEVSLLNGSFSLEFTPSLTGNLEVKFVVTNAGDGKQTFTLTANNSLFTTMGSMGQNIRVQSDGQKLVVVGGQ